MGDVTHMYNLLLPEVNKIEAWDGECPAAATSATPPVISPPCLHEPGPVCDRWQVLSSCSQRGFLLNGSDIGEPLTSLS